MFIEIYVDSLIDISVSILMKPLPNQTPQVLDIIQVYTFISPGCLPHVVMFIDNLKHPNYILFYIHKCYTQVTPINRFTG